MKPQRCLDRIRGAYRGRRLRRVCQARRCGLFAVHIQETGLKEHVEPVIAWLSARGQCLVVIVPNSQVDAYRRVSRIPFDRGASVWLLSERRFATVRCVPDVVVSIHPETPSAVARRFSGEATTRVVMPHGLSDKGALVQPECADALAECDVLFLSGPTFRDGSLRTYCDKHADIARRIRFVEIGAPKTDALFRPTVPRAQVLANLGLDPARPVVCYAPTHERTASLEQAGLEIMRALASLDANVIVKLHHCSLKRPADNPWIVQKTAGKDWRKIVQGLEHEYANLRLATAHDANPYLAATDVLVSDASGVAYEYLLLDRPLVFFDVPKLFESCGTNGIHYWGRMCGDVVRDVDALVRSVQRGLQNPTHKRREREEMIRRVVYTRGDATERAGRAILELADRGGPKP